MDRQRRRVLTSGLAAASAVAAAPVLVLRQLLEAFADSAPTTGRTLVILQLAGGNDGLNTVIPFHDSRYYDARPGIAIPTNQAIPLNDDIALHPSLAKLKSLWDDKVVAIVEGVGYPEPNYSHFRSMHIWQTGDPRDKYRDGWAGRCLEPLKGDRQVPLLALAVGNKLPPELLSEKVDVPIVANIPAYQFKGDEAYPASSRERLDRLLDLYAASPKDRPYGDLLGATLQVAYQSAQSLQDADKAFKPSVDYPNTPLASGFKLLAAVIAAGVGMSIGQVALGGFDTHLNQLPQQARLLTMVSEAVDAFYRDLKAQGKDKDVLIMTWSEFGRRVNSNASGGTDHGSAAPLFLVGTPVSGGLYGQRPDLGNLDAGNLRFTTDFRSIYATVAEDWLGVPAGAVFGQDRFPKLPVFVPAQGQ